MTTTLITDNRGIVKRVLNGGQSIEIELPRGGTFQCRNKGFEVGDQVCFSLDSTKQHVISIVPRNVANLIVAIAQDEDLQNVVMEDEHEEEDDEIDESNITSGRQSTQSNPNRWCGEIGGNDLGRESDAGDPDQDLHPDWHEYYSKMAEDD